jgi:hypothetical protein
MPYLLVRHTVEDYARWRPIYDEHAAGSPYSAPPWCGSVQRAHAMLIGEPKTQERALLGALQRL